MFAASRIGHSFSKEEIDELFNVMSQVSLAFDKANLYEETERNRQLNQDIIDHVNEAIQFIDQDGQLLHYNEAFKTILNCTDIIHKACLFKNG